MAQHTTTIANAPTPARPTRARRRLKELQPMLWFVPVLLLLLTVTLYPTLFVVWMSFQKTKFYELTGFVGLANYVDALSSRAFWETTYTSLIYMAGSLVISLGLGVLAALVLNNLRRGGAVLRVLTLVPWTLSMAVVGTIWLWLFNPSYGPISYSMRQVGLSPGLMLGDPELALWLTILVTSWWSFPYAMVIVTAAIQSIPRELYEAVSIDGGGWRAKLRYVTWPHLVPTLGSTALTLGILYLTLITLLIVLTGGGPLGATTTLAFDVFRGTVQAVNIGPTAVYSIAILLANVALGVLYMRLTGRVTA
jgi:multiple sugar transport system permease protein